MDTFYKIIIVMINVYKINSKILKTKHVMNVICLAKNVQIFQKMIVHHVNRDLF